MFIHLFIFLWYYTLIFLQTQVLNGCFFKKTFPDVLHVGEAFLERLSSFKAIATGTAFRITVTRIAYVNFSKRTKIACAVKLAIGYTATDTGIYVLSFIVHRTFPPLT